MAFFRSIARMCIAVLAFSSSFALADPPAPPPVNRAEALFLKPGQRGPAERAQLADELMKMYEDPASRPEEKAAALYVPGWPRDGVDEGMGFRVVKVR